MRTRLLLLLFFLRFTAADGQIGFSLESESGYSSNAYANFAALPDYHSTFNAGLTRDWLCEKNGIRLYYDGSYTAFKTYGDRDNHSHTLGTAWYTLLGERQHRLDAGVSISKRFHRSNYQLYEQEQLQLYGSIKYHLQPQWFLYAGGSWNLRRFPELSPFSHSRALLYGRSSWFFSTGTTFIAEADWLHKSYTSSTQLEQADFAEVATVGDGKSQQLLLLLRAAQGVTPRIGLSAEFQLRHNLASSTRYLRNTEGFYYTDEELFEDHFAFHGAAVLLTYRHTLPWEMRLTFSARREERNFDDRQAANLLGEPFPDGRLRQDQRTLLAVEWQKSVLMKAEWMPLLLTVNFSWLNNHSNDLYYNYTSQYSGVNFSWGW